MVSSKKSNAILKAIRDHKNIVKSDVQKIVGGNRVDNSNEINRFELNGVIRVVRANKGHMLSMYYDANGTQQIIHDLKKMRIPLKDYGLLLKRF